MRTRRNRRVSYMWEKIVKYNLEMWKIYYETCLKIIDRELENMEWDLKFK